MDTKQLKKIIAREGLIILGIFFFSILLLNSRSFLNSMYIKCIKLLNPNTIITGVTSSGIKYSLEGHSSIDSIVDFGWIFLLFGYPFYLLIRFVVWAIKTLKEK